MLFENNKIVYIYEITHLDKSIKENYIGSTEKFNIRKLGHRYSSNNIQYNSKLYKTIREYGGWNNWSMKIMSKYYCKNKFEKLQIEQKYIDIFKPTMNSHRAHSNNIYNVELNKKLDIELLDYKNKLVEYDNYINKFTNLICEYCNKTYANKSTLSTHQKSTKRCLEIQKNLNKKNNVIEYNCQYCNKIFTTKQNIKVHENICDRKKDFEIKEIKINYETEIKELKDIIINYESEIKDLKENMIKYESEIKELQEIKKDYISEKKLKNIFIFEIDDLRNTNKKYLEEMYKLRENIAELKGELKSEIKNSDRTTECVFEIAKQPN
jgi:chromosome segregation ATPase